MRALSLVVLVWAATAATAAALHVVSVQYDTPVIDQGMSRFRMGIAKVTFDGPAALGPSSQDPRAVPFANLSLANDAITQFPMGATTLMGSASLHCGQHTFQSVPPFMAGNQQQQQQAGRRLQQQLQPDTASEPLDPVLNLQRMGVANAAGRIILKGNHLLSSVKARKAAKKAHKAHKADAGTGKHKRKRKKKKKTTTKKEGGEPHATTRRRLNPVPPPSPSPPPAHYGDIFYEGEVAWDIAPAGTAADAAGSTLIQLDGTDHTIAVQLMPVSSKITMQHTAGVEAPGSYLQNRPLCWDIANEASGAGWDFLTNLELNGRFEYWYVDLARVDDSTNTVLPQASSFLFLDPTAITHNFPAGTNQWCTVINGMDGEAFVPVMRMNPHQINMIQPLVSAWAPDTGGADEGAGPPWTPNTMLFHGHRPFDEAKGQVDIGDYLFEPWPTSFTGVSVSDMLRFPNFEYVHSNAGFPVGIRASPVYTSSFTPGEGEQEHCVDIDMAAMPFLSVDAVGYPVIDQSRVLGLAYRTLQPHMEGLWLSVPRISAYIVLLPGADRTSLPVSQLCATFDAMAYGADALAFALYADIYEYQPMAMDGLVDRLSIQRGMVPSNGGGSNLPSQSSWPLEGLSSSYTEFRAASASDFGPTPSEQYNVVDPYEPTKVIGLTVTEYLKLPANQSFPTPPLCTEVRDLGFTVPDPFTHLVWTVFDPVLGAAVPFALAGWHYIDIPTGEPSAKDEPNATRTECSLMAYHPGMPLRDAGGDPAKDPLFALARIVAPNITAFQHYVELSNMVPDVPDTPLFQELRFSGPRHPFTVLHPYTFFERQDVIGQIITVPASMNDIYAEATNDVGTGTYIREEGICFQMDPTLAILENVWDMGGLVIGVPAYVVEETNDPTNNVNYFGRLLAAGGNPGSGTPDDIDPNEWRFIPFFESGEGWDYIQMYNESTLCFDGFFPFHPDDLPFNLTLAVGLFTSQEGGVLGNMDEEPAPTQTDDPPPSGPGHHSAGDDDDDAGDDDDDYYGYYDDDYYSDDDDYYSDDDDWGNDPPVEQTGGQAEGGDMGGAPIEFAIPVVPTASPMASMFGSMGGLDVTGHPIHNNTFYLGIILEMYDRHNGAIQNVITAEDFGSCTVNFAPNSGVLGRAIVDAVTGQALDATAQHAMQPRPSSCDVDAYAASRQELVSRIETMSKARDWDDMDKNTWVVTAASVTEPVLQCHSTFWNLFEASTGTGVKYNKFCTVQPFKEDPHHTGSGPPAWVENPAWWDDPCCNIAKQAEECCVAREQEYSRDVWAIAAETAGVLREMCGSDNADDAAAIINEAYARFNRDGFGTGSACNIGLDAVMSQDVWQTLTEFRVECDKAVREQDCAKHADCYSEKCNLESKKCVYAWDDPPSQARTLARCFADPRTKMDPVMRLAMQEYVHVVDFQDRDEFVDKLSAAFMGDEDCVGPTGWMYSGRHVRVNKDKACGEDGANERCQEEWVWQDGNRTECLAAKSCNWNRWNEDLTPEQCVDASLSPNFCGECDSPSNCHARGRDGGCFIHDLYSESECTAAGYAWDDSRWQCKHPTATTREECLPRDECPWSWPKLSPEDPGVNYCDPQATMAKHGSAGDSPGQEEPCVWPHIPQDWCGGMCLREGIHTAQECHEASLLPVWDAWLGGCAVDVPENECLGGDWEKSFIPQHMWLPNTVSINTRAVRAETICSILHGGDARYDAIQDRCYMALTDVRVRRSACEEGVVGDAGFTDPIIGCRVYGDRSINKDACIANQPTGAGVYVWRPITYDPTGLHWCVYEGQETMDACASRHGGAYYWDNEYGRCYSQHLLEDEFTWKNGLFPSSVEGWQYSPDGKRRVCQVDRQDMSMASVCNQQAAVAIQDAGVSPGWATYETGLGCVITLTLDEATPCAAAGDATWDSHSNICRPTQPQDVVTACARDRNEFLHVGNHLPSVDDFELVNIHQAENFMCVVRFVDEETVDQQAECGALVVPANAKFTFEWDATHAVCLVTPTSAAPFYGAMPCGTTQLARDGKVVATPEGCAVDLGHDDVHGLRQICQSIAGAHWDAMFQVCRFNMDYHTPNARNLEQQCRNAQDARFTGLWWNSPEDGNANPEFYNRNGTCVKAHAWQESACTGDGMRWVPNRWFDKGELNDEETCTTPSCDYWDMQGNRLTGDACLDPAIGYCTQQCKKCLSSTVWEWGKCFSAPDQVDRDACEALGGEMATAISGVCVVDRDRESCDTDPSLGGHPSQEWTWHTCTELAFSDPGCASVDSPVANVTGWAQELKCYPSRNAWCPSQDECEQPFNGECTDWEFVRWETANQDNNWQPVYGGCLTDFIPSERGVECDWDAGWSWSRQGCVRRDVTTAESCAAYGSANALEMRWVNKADTPQACEDHGSACNLPGVHSLVNQPDAEKCRACRGKPEYYYEWHAARWQAPPLRQFHWIEREWSSENRWVPAMNWSRIDSVVQHGVVKKMQDAIKESARCSHNLLMDYVHSLMCMCGGEGGAVGPGVSCPGGSVRGRPNATTVVAGTDVSSFHGVKLAEQDVYRDVPSSTSVPAVTVYVPAGAVVNSSSTLRIEAVPSFQMASVTTIAAQAEAQGLNASSATEAADARRRLEPLQLPYGITGTPVVDSGLNIKGQIVTDIVSLAIGGGLQDGAALDVCITVVVTVDITSWPVLSQLPQLPDLYMAEIGAFNEAFLFLAPVSKEANKLCATIKPSGRRPLAVVALTNATGAAAPEPFTYTGRLKPLFAYVDLQLPLDVAFTSSQDMFQLAFELHALPRAPNSLVRTWTFTSLPSSSGALVNAGRAYDINLVQWPVDGVPDDAGYPSRWTDDASGATMLVSHMGQLPPGDWRWGLSWMEADMQQQVMPAHPTATVTPIAFSSPAPDAVVQFPVTVQWTQDTNRVSQTLEIFDVPLEDIGVATMPVSTFDVLSSDTHSVFLHADPPFFYAINPTLHGVYTPPSSGHITVVLKEVDANMEQRTAVLELTVDRDTTPPRLSVPLGQHDVWPLQVNVTLPDVAKPGSIVLIVQGPVQAYYPTMWTVSLQAGAFAPGVPRLVDVHYYQDTQVDPAVASVLEEGFVGERDGEYSFLLRYRDELDNPTAQASVTTSIGFRDQHPEFGPVAIDSPDPSFYYAAPGDNTVQLPDFQNDIGVRGFMVQWRHAPKATAYVTIYVDVPGVPLGHVGTQGGSMRWNAATHGPAFLVGITADDTLNWVESRGAPRAWGESSVGPVFLGWGIRRVCVVSEELAGDRTAMHCTLVSSRPSANSVHPSFLVRNGSAVVDPTTAQHAAFPHTLELALDATNTAQSVELVYVSLQGNVTATRVLNVDPGHDAATLLFTLTNTTSSFATANPAVLNPSAYSVPLTPEVLVRTRATGKQGSDIVAPTPVRLYFDALAPVPQPEPEPVPEPEPQPVPSPGASNDKGKVWDQAWSWYKDQTTFNQVLVCAAASIALLLLCSVPVCVCYRRRRRTKGYASVSTDDALQMGQRVFQEDRVSGSSVYSTRGFLKPRNTHRWRA